MPVNLGPLGSPYWVEDYDSPYYFNPKEHYHETIWELPEPKQSFWQCKYCGSTNKDDVIKCESCNAPRPMQTSLASIWSVPPITTVQDRMQELDTQITEQKKELGLLLVEPFLKFIERISRLWNGR